MQARNPSFDADYQFPTAPSRRFRAMRFFLQNARLRAPKSIEQGESTWAQKLDRGKAHARIDVVHSEQPPKFLEAIRAGRPASSQACRWPINLVAGAARITDPRRELISINNHEDPLMIYDPPYLFAAAARPRLRKQPRALVLEICDFRRRNASSASTDLCAGSRTGV